MITDGGGWTLVYSYRFANFASFGSKSNAVTPKPNWPLSNKYVSSDGISTQVPLSETSYAAMDFNLWRTIGKDFLIKPTITNWVSCVPETGDFVNWKEGSIKCKLVKNVAKKCGRTVPKELVIDKCGIFLKAVRHYIYFDVSKISCFPVHDPCGTESISNHLTNVQNPGGAMYIR